MKPFVLLLINSFKYIGNTNALQRFTCVYAKLIIVGAGSKIAVSEL